MQGLKTPYLSMEKGLFWTESLFFPTIVKKKAEKFGLIYHAVLFLRYGMSVLSQKSSHPVETN